MTKNTNEVIIDGVDVSGCIDLSKKDYSTCLHHLYDKCIETKNCYFKQLQRLKKEYKQLQEKYNTLFTISKNMHESWNEFDVINEGLIDKLVKENAELKAFKAQI